MATIEKVTRVSLSGPNGQGMEACNLIDPNDVISEAKPQETLGVFQKTQGSDNEMGIWTCTSCVEQVKSFVVNEFCVVGDGEIILTDSNGAQEHFKKGDAFIMYQGFSGTYEVRGNLVKFFAVF